MKTLKLILVYFILNTLLFGQSVSNEAFDYLTTHNIGTSDSNGIIESISYDPQISELINIRFEDLNKSDHFYEEECAGGTIKLLRTKINQGSEKQFIITYNLSCCCDYGFSIYEGSEPYRKVGYILSNRLYIPGNGNIYADGRIYKKFNQRQKYVFTGDTLELVNQPFSYVGLQTKTLKSITLFYDKELSKSIAKLPLNYEIEVLLKEDELEDIYLVRTNFGLVGWTKIESGQYKSIDVEGIYYWGD